MSSRFHRESAWAYLFIAPPMVGFLVFGLGPIIASLALSFTPVAKLYRNRYGNALVVGAITAFGDAYSHPNHYGFFHAEALLTGAVSAALAVVASFLLEDRARRVRALWSSLRSRGRTAQD